MPLLRGLSLHHADIVLIKILLLLDLSRLALDTVASQERRVEVGGRCVALDLLVMILVRDLQITKLLELTRTLMEKV
jgi:hypothetical protein